MEKHVWPEPSLWSLYPAYLQSSTAIDEGALPPKLKGCGRCRKTVLSDNETAQDASGIPICLDCQTANVEPYTVSERLKHAASQILKREQREGVIDEKLAAALQTEVEHEIDRQLVDCSLDESMDMYTGQKHPGLKIFSPDSPSIDAINPCGVAEDDTIAVHCAANIAITRACTNGAKHTGLAGGVHEVGEYIRAREGASGDEELAELIKTLISRSNEQQAVRVKQQHFRMSRTAGKKSKSQLQASMQEWRSGKLGTHDTGAAQKWRQRCHRTFRGKKARRCGRDEETQRDILNILEEIEEEFETQLLRGKDGAP